MTKKHAIQLFEERKVRTVWDDEQEKWFFCVVDVVEALTDSKDPTDYIKKMKKRDPELSKGWGQIVTPLSVQTAGGKQRVNCAPKEGIFRKIVRKQTKTIIHSAFLLLLLLPVSHPFRIFASPKTDKSSAKVPTISVASPLLTL